MDTHTRLKLSTPFFRHQKSLGYLSNKLYLKIKTSHHSMILGNNYPLQGKSMNHKFIFVNIS